jgi:hypothetical protein
VQLKHASTILLLRMLNQYDWLSVVNVHVDELSSARIWQHKICETLSAILDISYRLLSLNMGWRILVFYPKRSRGIHFTNILSIYVKPQNTFCLPWIMSILICLTVQILWLKDGNLYLRLQTMSHIFYAASLCKQASD